MKMRTLFSAVALCATVATPLVPSASAQVQKIDVAGIRNFSRVDATIGCGGATDASAMPTLKKEGFVSVINLRLPSEPGANVEQEAAAAQAAGIKYIGVPFDAAMPDPKVVDRFLAEVSNKANQPAFIHCGSANRVGGVWMIKRVLQDGWAIDRAKTEAEAIGLRDPKLAEFATQYIATHKK